MNLEELENTRKSYAKKLIIVMIPAAIIFVIAMIVAVAFILNPSGSGALSDSIMILPIGFFLAMFLAIVGILVIRKDARNYKNMYKSYFVEQSLRKCFTDVQYNHEAGMPAEEISSTGMMRLGSDYSSNDLFTGKYHDVNIKQADVHMQDEYTDSDGHTHYVTIFKGRWMIFEFPKPFTFRLQVIQKWFGGAAKKAKKDKETGRKLKRISTESITFDKKFKIFAEDDFEAYYLLDPAFIDHIEQLSAQNKGKLMLCFIDNKLHVAFYDNKDAFEAPNPLKQIDEAKEFTKISQEIKVITDYVDFLKLDHKLFEKPNNQVV